MFSVMRTVNGQNEYLNESNHVKYFKNKDSSFNGIQCDRVEDKWSVHRKCALIKKKIVKTSKSMYRARLIVQIWLARSGWETAIYRSNVIATVIHTLEQTKFSYQLRKDMKKATKILPAISKEKECECTEFAAEITRENWSLFIN